MENTEFKNIRGNNYKNIKGWGVDADPENDPTYPMKDKKDLEHEGYTWDRPEQQPLTVEVLHSNERPNVTAVYGTSTPPAGLSGQIRRFAFKYSESSYGHWLPLVLADRIGVFEGIVDDFKRGIVPNIFKERGWTAEWKYNRQGFIKNIVVGTLVASTAIALLSISSRSKKH